uniref:cyclin-T1-4-like isoform X2 n=1 Tax=Erigeron canadensis TaxID=72917 RepID=UPI001CB8A830|nr:cyclin-T1-4-like isoform X2 [Erigeron canadensis]
MSLARSHHAENSQFPGDFRSSFGRNHPHMFSSAFMNFTNNRRYVNNNNSNSNSNSNNNYRRSYNNTSNDFPNESRLPPPQPQQHYNHNVYSCNDSEALPSFKRRKFSATNWESNGTSYNQYSKIPFLPLSAASDANARGGVSTTSCKRDRTRFEDEDVEFLSRDQIERFSPSRKDGIDAMQETHLRYSYCAFLQDLGLRLELPQTTIGTAMVLCHRFFVRRSHASHDRFVISTAALFLAAKSEETPCPLNTVLRVSSELFHKQDFNVLCYLLPVDWFDQYRERVIEAEQLVLTTLNFELNVQHPYAHLSSILDKLGLAQSLLVNLALSLVSEGAIEE